MRTWTLCLLLALAPSFAPSALANETVAVAPSGPAVATVLDHVLSVTVDSRGALKQVETWTVRIDDPGARLIPAPPTLEGVASGESRIERGRVVLAGGTAAGATLTFSSTVAEKRGPFDGAFRAAPGLPAEKVRVELRFPTTMNLAVWADRPGTTTWVTKNVRGVDYAWGPGDAPAAVVWSTWKDWAEVSRAWDKELGAKLSKGDGVAPLADAPSIGAIAGKVYAAVKLAPTAGRYVDARKVDVVLSEGTPATAAERALVLVSALKTAGYDAFPAAYRPHGELLDVAVGQPAPAYYGRPAVAVETESGTVWIDPAAEDAAIGDLPASMIESVAWRTGKIPVKLKPSGLSDGAVDITGALSLLPDGTANFTASVKASGAARQYLRKELGGMDAAARTEKIKALMGLGREITQLRVTAIGLDKPQQKVEIILQGSAPSPLRPLGEGFEGAIAPLLSAGLASILPSNVPVKEVLTVQPPPGVPTFATGTVEHAIGADALFARTVRVDGENYVLVTQSDRPYRASTPARDASAAEFLRAQAAVGGEITLFGPVGKKTPKSVAKVEGKSATELVVLQALLYWAQGNEKKASKTLPKALGSWDAAVDALARHAPIGDFRPWKLAYDAASTDAQRLRAQSLMAKKGLSREAWQLATALTQSTDPAVRIEAFLAIVEYQGERPDPNSDPQGHAAWKDPTKLLKTAQKMAQEGGGAGDDLRLLVPMAEASLLKGKPAAAKEFVDAALAVAPSDPVVRILAVEIAAGVDGLPIDQAVAQVEAALVGASDNPEAFRHAARAMGTFGRHEQALAYAFDAARREPDDPERWMYAIEPSLAAGNLGAAVDAARRASDLDPSHKMAGIRLKILALQAGDLESSNLGAQRSAQGAETMVPSLAQALDIAGEQAHLALLNHRDAEVVADAAFLAMRAEKRLAAGQLDEAMLDGMRLVTDHREEDGEAFVFAASAGRFWAPNATKFLDAAARKSVVAKKMRMEWALVTGSSDPLSDAKLLRDDERAQKLLMKPDLLAADVEGWTTGQPNPKPKAPPTYRSNKMLSGASGAVGYSDALAGVSLIWTSGNSGVLPPPIGGIYKLAAMPTTVLPSGAKLYRLEGGILPAYAAFQPIEGGEIVAVGFSAQDVAAALALAAR